jgi:Tfp pilus assembly protein FimT
MTRRSFTLLEMVLVLAVVVILTALVLPSMATLYRQYKVAAAADSIKAAMTSARAQAVEDGQPYSFAILTGKSNFRVAPENPGYWAGGAPPAADSTGNKPFILEDHLPNSIIFTEGEHGALPDAEEDTVVSQVSAEQWKKVATFLPDGTARDDVTIVVRGHGGRPMIVTLRSFTGSVTARRGSPTE